MKKGFLLLLCILSVLVLAACNQPQQPADETDATETTDAAATETPETTTAAETEKAEPNVFKAPTVEEARKIVLDYSRQMAAVKWIAKSDMDFSKEKSYTSKLKYKAGETYYGMPYISSRDCMEQLELALDASGVYIGPITYDKAIGNSCASSIRVSFDNVSTKLQASGSHDFIPMANKGIVKVGDYTWDPVSDATKYDSSVAVKKNGEQVICQAYAKLVPGDTISARWPNGSAYNGHARLISGETKVVLKPNGEINPARSYVTIIEQNSSFDATSKVNTTWKVDQIYTFASLLEKGYLPGTLEEFTTGEFEDGRIDFKNITEPQKIFENDYLSGTVTSNYYLFKVKASIFDSSGKEVSSVTYAPHQKEVKMGGRSFQPSLKTLPADTYRLVITAKIGLGEYVYCDTEVTKK